MTTAGDRELVARAVDQGLFADQALSVPENVDVPEKYVLLGYLGRGGAGRVYLARDTVLDRRVALKFLTDVRAADLARFRREARLTARLNVPSIVQIYEMGDSGAAPYIAMQYLEGGNLGSAELSETHLVRAIRQVALALEHAHRAGIVHRDIKPANILLDAGGNAFLTDFGVARDLTTSSGPTLSTEGQIMGTPALMPPEQARGDLRAIDARSDVYALGASLFLKLTGRYPFERDNVVDVLHAVIHDEPPMLRSLKASVPRSLEALVLRCMRKRPAERYGSMGAVVADLDRHLEGATAPGESGAWFGRLVRTIVGAPEQATPVEPVDDSRGTELETLRELSAWDANLYRVSRDICRYFGQLNSIVERLDAILAGRPGTGWARFYRGVALFRCGRLQEALEEMERSVDRVEDRAGAQFELGRLSLALYLRAHHDAQQHLSQAGVLEHLHGARRLLDQAAVAFEEAGRLSDRLPRWQVEMAQAVQHLATGDHAECVRACDRILEREPEVEEVWKLRGDALRFSGADPRESYERALDIRRAYYEAAYALAESSFQGGHWSRARAEVERALEICPEYADALALLARTHLEQARQTASPGPLRDGLGAIDRALAVDARHYGAVTTRIELLLEDHGLRGDASVFEELSRLIELASGLEGCQNRVNLLHARLRLAGAVVARDEGVDPRTEVDAVLRMSEEARRRGPDAQWEELGTRARELLGRGPLSR